MANRNSKDNELVQIIDRHLAPRGYTRRGKKWWKECDEVIHRLSLRKDLWKASQHYLEIDVSVRELNRGPEPEWHITGSMFSPDVCMKVEWEKCLNSSRDEVSGEPRAQRLEAILVEKIVPLLEELEDVEGTGRALRSGRLKGMGVRTELQELMGYSP